MNLRNYILEVWEQSGLSAYALAKRIPCSQSLLCRFRRNERDVSLLVAQRIIDECTKPKKNFKQLLREMK